MSDIQQRRLDELLAGREGWRQEQDPHAGTLWCFGVAGEARLVLSVSAGRYVLYSATTNDELEPTSIEDVRRWLDLIEPDHAGLSPLGEELARHLGGVLTEETQEWLEEDSDC